ncbi:MAG: class I SAM-dependent methyltransferase family protein [Methanobacteriota archaeon]|nr:MAG: class I SAM-dependent methyltransferase family protein [Euryarchaeota archaeon]
MVRGMGVKVRPDDAEKARRRLKEQGALSSSRKARREGGGVVFPVKDGDIDLGPIPFELVEAEFEELKGKDAFERFLEKQGCSLSSYDVIGDIAILEIPEGMEVYEREIARVLLDSKRHVKAVFKKSSAVEGEERVRRYEWLAGEDRTETAHREHGCIFRLDISKVFFSPRLSFERQRIMEQVRDGEVIVDMFAGVGPYSIVIARHRDAKVTGYDINEAAIRYFAENIRINKVGHRVTAVHGDCRELAPEGVADRVIMNLPKSGKEFLETALDTLKPEGGVIHYYGVSPRAAPYKDEARHIQEKAKEMDKKVEITGKRIVRSYSPGEVHVAIDVKVMP